MAKVKRRKQTSAKRRTRRHKNPNELSPHAEKLIRELDHDCAQMVRKIRRTLTYMRSDTAAYGTLQHAAKMLDQFPEELSMTLDAYAD